MVWKPQFPTPQCNNADVFSQTALLIFTKGANNSDHIHIPSVINQIITIALKILFSIVGYTNPNDAEYCCYKKTLVITPL